MTQKHIITEKKAVSTIEKGTWLKKNGEFFIVSKISEAQFNEVVEQALFEPRPRNNQMSTYMGAGSKTSIMDSFQSPFNVGSVTVCTKPPVARRDPSNAKYVLINVSSGSKFYPEFLTLTELLMRITKAGFEVVEKVEIKELA